MGHYSIVKSNKGTGSKYWRIKTRKFWNDHKNRLLDRYRNREIGEDIFDSLTNWFGDRLKIDLIASTIVRIGVRIVSLLGQNLY